MNEQWKQKIMQQWQEQSDKVKAWWSRLTLQEKGAVSVGGSVLGLFLFFVLIWSPFLSHLDTMRKRIKSDESALSWMQGADVKIQAIESQEKDSTKSISPVALMSELQKQVNQNALGQSLTQLKQVSNDTIEMDFKQVEFDKVITFLTSTIKEHRVSIDQFSATAGGAPGLVDIQMVLKLM